MKYIQRSEIKEDIYVLIFENESHHNHKIVMDGNVIRWEQNNRVNDLVDKMDLNQILALFRYLGYDKNSEVHRKLYRDIGYSLFGYWEIFYWKANNEHADEYRANSKYVESDLRRVLTDFMAAGCPNDGKRGTWLNWYYKWLKDNHK